MTWQNEIRKKETNLPDEVKEAINKVAEEMERALQGIDHELLLSIITPHGGKMYKDKNELVDSLVQSSIKDLKENYTQYERWEGTPVKRPTPVGE